MSCGFFRGRDRDENAWLQRGMLRQSAQSFIEMQLAKQERAENMQQTRVGMSGIPLGRAGRFIKEC